MPKTRIRTTPVFCRLPSYSHEAFFFVCLYPVEVINIPKSFAFDSADPGGRGVDSKLLQL